MITKDLTISTRLKEDFDYVTSLGYNVLGVFLQGSQNYQLDYEGSDIDTKAIIIPSFVDFVLNCKPVSTTLVLPSNEHIDLKDIRLMHECFRKQNINFIEILFTKYRYMNPEYAELYQPMFDNNEKIAHYNNYASLNCMCGMIMEKHKAMEHPYPTIIDKIEKYGYDPKQLHHIIRVHEFMSRYIAGVSYAECLIPADPEYLIKVKSDVIYELEIARELAKGYEISAKATKDRYMETHPPVVDTEVDEIMNNMLFEVLKHSFRKEINE